MSSGDPFSDLVDTVSFNDVVPNGSKLLLAVSGGADSVAMLLAVNAIAKARSLVISVAHVNHGLRPEADKEELFVRNLCAGLQIECHIKKLEPAIKPSNTSPEQFWRQSRYSYFQQIMILTSSHFVALGHTVDDLAETFLFHLARGTGIDGLCFSFFKMAGELPIIRPLWKVNRNNIELALNSAGQGWMSDVSNNDIRYSRNLIRHQVLPALQAINPSVVDAIQRLSNNLQNLVSNERETGPLSLTGKAGGRYVHISAINGLCVLNLSGTTSSEAELSSIIRHYVNTAAHTVMGSRQTAQAASIIQRKGTGLVALSGQKTLVLTQLFGWIYPGHEPTDKMLAQHHSRCFAQLAAHLTDRTGHLVNSPAGVRALDESFWRIRWSGGENLIIRNRQAGDRVGSKLLAKLLIDFKIPWYLRPFAVVAMRENGNIVAVAGLSQSLNDWIARHTNTAFELTTTKSESAV